MVKLKIGASFGWEKPDFAAVASGCLFWSAP